MKVRIGYGLGIQKFPWDRTFFQLVDALERYGFDSLWLSERIGGDVPDPLVGLAVAAGRTERIKLGTSVQVLPGRNPVLLAKAWASLDRLSGGRTLPAFGLGNPIAAEHQAFGVRREARGSVFDEVLPLIRRLWSEDDIDHDGSHFHYRGLTVQPKPVQQPLDVWLGGRARSELRRCGRLGDGWLASFCTPADCVSSRPLIEETGRDVGRTIDSEHFGAMVTYARDEIPDLVRQRLAAVRPEVDPADLVPVGLSALRQRLVEFVSVGFSKLVVIPLVQPNDWTRELEVLGAHVLDLQT